jgi:sarcosine oxidase
VAEAVETDVLVLGLGAVGAAVAYQLDRRGVPFIALERQPAAGHGFGSSHGESRITREAVGEGLDYIPLVQRSHEIVAELETPERRLREEVGVLYLASGDAGGARHGATDFMAATRRAAEVAGVELVALDAAALRRDYPQFQVSDDTVGYLEPRAGFLRPERCIEAQLGAIAAPQEKLRFGETVLGLARSGDGVSVTTDAGAYRAKRCVVAMGAWTPGFVGEPFRREVKVLRQTLHWFAPDPGGPWAGGPIAGGGGPVFLWFHGPGEGDVFYGFPALQDGKGGVKVATEQYAVATAPDAADWTVSEAETQAMFDEHVRGRLAGVSERRIDAKACLYTWNNRTGNDRSDGGHKGRFLIGSHRDIPGVTVVSACSGHGFKHSLGLGDAVVRQILGEPGFCDLSVFNPDR